MSTLEHEDTGNAAKSVAIKRLGIGSDVEIAERVKIDLERQFSDGIVFADGRFYHYDKTHWLAFTDSFLHCLAHTYDGAQYMSPEGKDCAVKLSKSRVKSIIHEMGMKLALPDFFAEAPLGINCSSGFIKFGNDGTPQLLSHSPLHRCRHVVAGRWAPGALTEPPLGSLLKKLLHGVFVGDPDADDKRKLLAELAGSAAAGIATKLRRPRAIILVGERAENGKSQILDMQRGSLPKGAVSAVSASKFGDEKFIVRLAGKQLNASDEFSSVAAISSEIFKRVITGEPIEGRDVYRSAVEFRSTAQQAFSCNQLPKFAGGMDRGVRRRIRAVTFNRVIPDAERIENIGLRVAEEEPDLVLAWTIGGATRLIKQREFTEPASSAAAMREWLHSDSVIAWATARVEPRDLALGEKPPGIKSSYAHNLFRQWALSEGYKEGDIPGVNGFTQRLQAVDSRIKVKHRSSGNWLIGLKILATDKKDSDDVDEQLTTNVLDFNQARTRQLKE
jgi:phage/plasmid-associated DNA primase